MNTSTGEASSSIAPNPANSNIVITSLSNLPYYGTGEKLITEIRIYDVIGRLRKTKTFSKVRTANVNIADLLNGLYFVEIYYGKDKEVKQLKILR